MKRRFSSWRSFLWKASVVRTSSWRYAETHIGLRTWLITWRADRSALAILNVDKAQHRRPAITSFVSLEAFLVQLFKACAPALAPLGPFNKLFQAFLLQTQLPDIMFDDSQSYSYPRIEITIEWCSGASSRKNSSKKDWTSLEGCSCNPSTQWTFNFLRFSKNWWSNYQAWFPTPITSTVASFLSSPPLLNLLFPPAVKDALEHTCTWGRIMQKQEWPLPPKSQFISICCCADKSVLRLKLEQQTAKAWE